MPTYLEYLAKSRKQKINPEYMVPSTCQLPASARPRKQRKIQPPLDIAPKKRITVK